MDKNKNKKVKNKITLIVAVVLIVVITNLCTFFASTTLNVVFGNKVIINAGDSVSAKSIAKMVSLKDNIVKNYYDKVDVQALWDTAMKGLFAGTGDQYSTYYTKKEFNSYMGGYEASYGGIGVQITMETKTNKVFISAVFKNTPASKSGLKTNDIIKKIDDKSVTGKDVATISNLVRGKKGTSVKLTVLRGNKTMNFNVTRDTIKLTTCSSKVINNNIGYINISQFNEETGKEFKDCYTKVKNKNVKALIIDLRNNPGGLVEQASTIAQMFLDKGDTIISTTNKNNINSTLKDETSENATMPIVVLVNENSASSSEILSCALKDNKKATIIGVKSYGKGIIQGISNLTDGSGFTLTTEEYISPNGNKIHKKGITPDITIKAKKAYSENLAYKDDNQLQRAVKYLQNK